MTLFFPIKLTKIKESAYLDAADSLDIKLKRRIYTFNTSVESWEITSFEPNLVEVQLYFQNPLYISTLAVSVWNFYL